MSSILQIVFEATKDNLSDTRPDDGPPPNLLYTFQCTPPTAGPPPVQYCRRAMTSGIGSKVIFWDVCSQHNLSSTVESQINGIRGIPESQESLESRSSEGENGRLKINVAENVRSLVHFRAGSRRLVAQETRTVPGRRLACSGAPPHVARP
jgi:hypothetical protein